MPIMPPTTPPIELLNTPPGGTDIPSGRLKYLIDKTLTKQADVNALEAANILEALTWLARRRSKAITSAFVRELHRQMFGKVWMDAGQFRLHDTNLGIGYPLIPVEVEKLVREATDWIALNSYKLDELAVRFHHRLVLIHPFADGNGRHTRLIADYVLTRVLKVKRFTWGSAGEESLRVEGHPARDAYIAALHEADSPRAERPGNGDYGPLLAFVRS
jgi:Fic-DOC domain mobile mystery protein B